MGTKITATPKVDFNGIDDVELKALALYLLSNPDEIIKLQSEDEELFGKVLNILEIKKEFI